MISIIIPFYNTGKSCAQLVKQLLNDKQRDVEIICVDDSSTDDSLKIVNAACKKDKRAKAIHLEKNHGSAAAPRNRGLEEASGEYVIFLDSDDDVAEIFLTKMLEGITEDNSVLAVCGIRQNYLHSGKIVDKFTTPASEQRKNETWEEYILRLMIEDAHLYSCVNKIYKRKYITAGKVRFDTELDFAEDTKFVLDYLKQAGKEKERRQGPHHRRLSDGAGPGGLGAAGVLGRHLRQRQALRRGHRRLHQLLPPRGRGRDRRGGRRPLCGRPDGHRLRLRHLL